MEVRVCRDAIQLFITTSSASPWSLTFRTRRNGAFARSRCCCTCRDNPQLNSQVFLTAAVNRRDTSSFDAARVDQVVLGTVGTGLPFAFTTAVGDDGALRLRIVLQLNCVVVETSLLIVEADVAILVKLPRSNRHDRLHRSGAGCCA